MKYFAFANRLKPKPKVLEQYIHYHDHIFPEVVRSFKAVGMVDIRIWRRNYDLFMIVCTNDGFEWETNMSRYLTLHPKNREWEDLMAGFQEGFPDTEGDNKWIALEDVFSLM